MSISYAKHYHYLTIEKVDFGKYKYYEVFCFKNKKFALTCFEVISDGTIRIWRHFNPGKLPTYEDHIIKLWGVYTSYEEYMMSKILGD